jgi:hypothetical protein
MDSLQERKGSRRTSVNKRGYEDKKKSVLAAKGFVLSLKYEEKNGDRKLGTKQDEVQVSIMY